MNQGLEILSDALCIVGEGCVWLPKEKKIAFVDIRGKTVRKLEPASGKMQITAFPQKIAFLAESTDGSLLAGAEDGIYRIDMDGGFVRMNRPFQMKGDRFNDGKVGPDGRLYAGTICSQGQQAALYRMDGDGSMTQILDGVGNSNGLDWDERLGVLYYNDTRIKQTDAFDFEPGEGSLSHRRNVVAYTGLGSPDGMCIDENGHLWTALWGGSRVVCVDPKQKRIVSEIPLPVVQPSCCCFWGEQLENLAITSAAAGRAIGAEPLSGALFTIKVGACGVPRHSFDMKRVKQ